MITARTLRHAATAALLSGAAASDAHADEAGEVVVHGSEAGGFTSRARLEDAPREVPDVASLIEPLPGVHVRRLGGDDSFATLSIRGSTSNEVAVRLAGVPLTGASDPSLDLSTLPLWPGVRARVYRSFAPGALGQGSLGGTLVLDPPRAGDPERTEVWAAAGSFGAARIRAGDIRALGSEGARVVTALSASRADDDFSYYSPLPPAGFRTRQNAQHEAVNGLASIALPVHYAGGEEGTLTVTTLAQARRQHLPGSISDPTPFAVLDSNRELASLELTRPAGAGAWIVGAWGRRDDLRVRNPASPLTLGPTHSNDLIVGTGGSFGWRGSLARRLHLEARADASGERFAPGFYAGAFQPAGATRVAAGTGADLTWEAARALTFTGTGRVDAWSDHASDGTGGNDVRPTGHVGTELAAGPLTFAGHAGALARPPSFIERYGNRGGIVGDASLRSESAFAADVGVRAGAGRAATRVEAELVGFATWAEDLIVLVQQGLSGLKATNIGKARLFGLEAELRARAWGFELRASYTGLWTYNDAECAGAVGCEAPPLPGRPAHDFVADLTYTLGPARVRYGIDALSGMRADPNGSITVPARVLHSAGGYLDVPGVPGLRVGLDVRNLFDLRVATYDGFGAPALEPIGDLYQYPLPGRTVLVTARWLMER